MSELQRFKDNLERELLTAIHSSDSPSTSRPRLVRAVPAVIAVLISAAAGGVIGVPALFGAPTASAETISITHLQDRVEIRVVDVVTDPDEVTRKLEDELGITADLLAVASSPALVGRIGAVGNVGPTEVEVRHNVDGTLDLIILPAGFSGSLTIEYGRKAAPGERYGFSDVDGQCSMFYGLTVTESLEGLRSLAPSLRFHSTSADLSTDVDIDPLLIPASFTLTRLLPLSSDSYLATYSEDPTYASPHPNCE